MDEGGDPENQLKRFEGLKAGQKYPLLGMGFMSGTGKNFVSLCKHEEGGQKFSAVENR